MRGLKRDAAGGMLYCSKSHPTWVRGLKLEPDGNGFLNLVVAPYVGAWIETIRLSISHRNALSHPTWVRGLKPSAENQIIQNSRVAPYVGAWIETLKSWFDTSALKSHPTWVRGLKL